MRRLIKRIRQDNLDLIVDIEKQKQIDLEIPPDVITAKNSLLDCLKMLHKSTLMDILLFMKDIDQFEKECINRHGSENELEYTRLVQEVRDKLDVITAIKDRNVLEIPQQVIVGKKRLVHCLQILHKQRKI